MKTTAKILLAGAALLSFGALCMAHPGHPPLATANDRRGRQRQPDLVRAFPRQPDRRSRPDQRARHTGPARHRREPVDPQSGIRAVDRRPEGFKIEAKGVGGVTEAELVSGLTARPSAASRPAMRSVGVMDLSALERSIGRPISAIVGRDFFNAAVVSIDWAEETDQDSLPGSVQARRRCHRH